MQLEHFSQPSKLLLKEKLEPSQRPIDVNVEKEVIRAINCNDVLRMRTLLRSVQHMYIYGKQKKRLLIRLQKKLNIK